MTFIFNLSLATGVYIDEWKRARVTPIFKSGDRRQCENYRPISFNDYFISIGSRLAAEYVDESCSNVDNQPINYNINQSSDTSLNYLQYPLIVLPRP